MHKRAALSLAVALACSSAGAADYIVVVPVPGKTTPTTAISVNLGEASLPSGIAGQPYGGFDFKSVLTVTGDPAFASSGVRWTIASGSLPAGLTLSSAGRLTGTPAAAGTSSFQLKASYRTKEGAQTYQVVVGAITIALGSATPAVATIGRPYSFDLAALLSVSGDADYHGAGVTWSVVSSTLPAGLYLTTDGHIAGTPTASGSGSVRARATYKGSQGEQTYEVVTQAFDVVVASATPPEAKIGQAYSFDLSSLLTVNGQGVSSNNVSWAIASGALPNGLRLATNGIITGTPVRPAVGSSKVTARATYQGATGEQTFDIAGLDVTMSLADATLPAAIINQAYQYDLKPLLSVAGDSKYASSDATWSLVSGTLPPGVSLRSDGVLAGTASGVTSSGNITIRAAYKGFTADRTYAVTASDALSVVDGTKAPLGAVGSLFLSQSYDDQAFQINMPFSLNWFGVSKNTAFLSSNSYLTFGAGASNYSGLSLTALSYPGIMFGGADNSIQRAYTSSGTTKNGVAYLRIRYEGTASTSGTVGSPNIVTEITLFAPQLSRQVVEVVVGQHARPTAPFGVMSPVAANTVSGTLVVNQSYVFQSDANGSNWTITPGKHVE